MSLNLPTFCPFACMLFKRTYSTYLVSLDGRTYTVDVLNIHHGPFRSTSHRAHVCNECQIVCNPMPCQMIKRDMLEAYKYSTWRFTSDFNCSLVPLRCERGDCGRLLPLLRAITLTVTIVNRTSYRTIRLLHEHHLSSRHFRPSCPLFPEKVIFDNYRRSNRALS